MKYGRVSKLVFSGSPDTLNPEGRSLRPKINPTLEKHLFSDSPIKRGLVLAQSFISLWAIASFMYYSRSGTFYESTIRFLMNYRRCSTPITNLFRAMSSNGVEGKTELKPWRKLKQNEDLFVCCWVIQSTDKRLQLHWWTYPRVDKKDHVSTILRKVHTLLYVCDAFVEHCTETNEYCSEDLIQAQKNHLCTWRWLYSFSIFRLLPVISCRIITIIHHWLSY